MVKIGCTACDDGLVGVAKLVDGLNANKVEIAKADLLKSRDERGRAGGWRLVVFGAVP